MIATSIPALATHPLVVAFGWALVHFLWQAILIAMLIGGTLVVMRRRSAAARYAVACCGMAAMALAPIATTVWLNSGPRDSSSLSLAARAVATQYSVDTKSEVPAIAVEQKSTSPTQPNDFSKSPQNLEVFSGNWSNGIVSRGLSRRLEPWLPVAVGVWALGVMGLSARMLGGLFRIRKLRRNGIKSVSEEFEAVFQHLLTRMKIRSAVRLAESSLAQVPAVIGWLRPTILVPASVISGLPTSELEALLAHELAHIRRHDYLLNLVQSVVETLLFYHPAVWWLSRTIRSERENCCDDVAISVGGNRVALVRALAHLEELRCDDRQFVVAANGGSLLYRIRRVVGRDENPLPLWWPAGLLTLLCLVGLTAAAGISMAFGNDPIRQSAGEKKSTINSGKQDPKKSNRPGLQQLQKIPLPMPPPRQQNLVDYPMHKAESTKIDARTGAEKRLLADVQLSVTRGGTTNIGSVDLAYSSVVDYTFIPARIAKALNAEELGEIDFGSEIPRNTLDDKFQQIILDQLNVQPKKISEPVQSDGRTLSLEAEKRDQDKRPNPIYVGTDVGDQRNILFAPNPDHAVWVTGHLGFYNMNGTQQHKFKVVRIDRVDFGFGPEFGPVNALVLNDENSEFGILGREWAVTPKGVNGEGFISSAVEGFFFARINEQGQMVVTKKSSQEKQQSPDNNAASARKDAIMHRAMMQQLNGVPKAKNQLKVEVLATREFDTSRRESSKWIEINGTSVPVDHAVEAEGVKVYLSLIFDVIAVDPKTEKVIWHVDWNKTDPIWGTVSIVKISQAEKEPRLAVELFPQRSGGALSFRYHDLQNGLLLDEFGFQAKEQRSINGVTATLGGGLGDPMPDPIPEIHVLKRDGEQVVHAEATASPMGRSTAELIQRFAKAIDGPDGAVGWITDRETIISAESSYWLLGPGIDAMEVTFSLPEGSGLRTEFSGDDVAIDMTLPETKVTVTRGKIELIDSTGVTRAVATPDGGAEKLVVTGTLVNGEQVLKLRTELADTPVQVRMILETGAPADEKDPPHGSVRYTIEPPNYDKNEKIGRLKMLWRYDLERLVYEFEKSGGSLDESPDGNNQAASLAPQSTADSNENVIRQIEVLTPETAADDKKGWGPESNGLRTRLTLLSSELAVGQPLKVRYEVRNFSDQDKSYDPQTAFAFRVLSVTGPEGKPDSYIGGSFQTVGGPTLIKPAETQTLFDDVDAAEFFLMGAPGEYKLKCGAAGSGPGNQAAILPESNVLTIELEEGELNEPKGAFLRLQQRFPPEKKWEITMRSGAIYITHLASNLKSDATTIQIWFTEEKLADDFRLGNGDQSQDIGYLGQHQLGHAYIAALPRAKKLAPDYVELVHGAIMTREGDDPDERHIK